MFESYRRYWRTFLDISGRSGRKDFWWPVIINAVLGAIILGFVESALGHPISDIYSWTDLTVQFGHKVVIFIVWLASLTVTVRRLHDTDRVGWWIFIQLIPIIGNIWFFILMILPGKTSTRWD